MPVMETGNAASISRMQVGLVTLTSVSLSPIISRPTKSALWLSMSDLRGGQFPSRCRSADGLRRGHRRRGCHGFRRPVECVPAVWHRFTIDHQHALITVFDRRQIILRHAEELTVVGQRFSDHAEVGIIFLMRKIDAPPMPSSGEDYIAMLLPERAQLLFVARHQRVWRQVGKPAV